MHRRLWVFAGFLLAATGIALSAGGAYAYFWDHGRADLIAEGVRIADIDVGGLRAAEASLLLDRHFSHQLSHPVHVVYGTHDFLVRPARAGVRVDVARMVDAAVHVSREGGLAHRLWRDLRGKRQPATIPLTTGISEAHVQAFAARVAHILDRPAHNARVIPDPLATELHVIRSRIGLAVKRPLLVQRLTNALLGFDNGPHTIAVPTRTVYPRWPTTALPRRYGTYLLVSRETFTLRLFKRLKLVRTYPIAVGRAGLETPAGLYDIDDKQINPSWHVPDSAWAGALAGQIIPPGPADPLKARWLGFYNGAGIHGTADTWSLGSAASHGCIRMSIPDVEQLYDLVPLHTPIYVG
jgi:L,D-transpeptidase catalytic domain/Putative peptidoglycan binding domain